MEEHSFVLPHRRNQPRCANTLALARQNLEATPALSVHATGSGMKRGISYLDLRRRTMTMHAHDEVEILDDCCSFR